MSWKLVGDTGRAALLLVLAQSTTSRPPLKVVKLEPPVYPPIAMAARVTGEVDLTMTLQQNGKAGNVQVENGPQMLKQAAVDSLTRSTFESDPVHNAADPYQFVYQFSLDKAPSCSQERDKSYPHIHYESNTVTISEQAITICDPAIERTRVRSIKCLYLWKCGLR
jgi:Gram-negative bacterial TonB protein C-terminal